MNDLSVVSVLTPKKIYDEVSKTIVGQHKAKKLVANAMYLHLVRLFKLAQDRETNPEAKMDSKSNILLMGPSGCGKTFIVRETAKAIRRLTGLSVFEMLEVDSTGLTSKGWEGDDLDDMIGNFYTNRLNHNKDLFDASIIYLDEFDKKVMPAVGSSGTDHNKQLQYNLLKMVEGRDIEVKGRDGRAIIDTINTSNVLFIFSGSFEEVRNKRKDNGSKLGFTFNNLHEQAGSLHEALIEVGAVTELVGRIGFVGEIEQLEKDELIQILIEHVVPKAGELLGRIGINLDEEGAVFEEIADHAIKRKTGARGLDVELFTVLEDRIFNSGLNL